MNEDAQTDDVNVTSLDNGEGVEPQVDETGAGDPVTSTSEKKPEPVKLKTRPIPAIFTLLGGAAVTVSVFLQQLEFRQSLVLILLGLVLCLIIGEAFKILLDRIELPNPHSKSTDGNVIQKGKSGEEQDISSGDEASSSQDTAAES